MPLHDHHRSPDDATDNPREYPHAAPLPGEPSHWGRWRLLASECDKRLAAAEQRRSAQDEAVRLAAAKERERKLRRRARR